MITDFNAYPQKYWYPGRNPLWSISINDGFFGECVSGYKRMFRLSQYFGTNSLNLNVSNTEMLRDIFYELFCELIYCRIHRLDFPESNDICDLIDLFMKKNRFHLESRKEVQGNIIFHDLSYIQAFDPGEYENYCYPVFSRIDFYSKDIITAFLDTDSIERKIIEADLSGDMNKLAESLKRIRL